MDEFEKWIEQEIYRNPVTIFRTEALQEALAKYHTIKPKEEPLAVLADRKGCFLGSQWNGKEHYINPFPGWRIDVIKKDGSWAECCTGDTYPAAEAAAREYLNSLPDKGEGK